MTLSAGTRLGPYEIEARIGAGGMGEVYRARDMRLDRTVAIKVLPQALEADPQFRERFDREARTVAALNHPHICTIHDVGQEGGAAYLVMELIAGETLAARLQRGALPLEDALRIAMDVASGLDAAHRAGIVHRDLKPGNIMLTKSGGLRQGLVQGKLLDFGLAKPVASVVAGAGASMLTTMPENLTVQGTILGTLQYMAPEQLEGREADARADIFAFGAILYEMLTGKRAFQGKSQASLITSIMSSEPPPIPELQPLAGAAVDHVVRVCLAKDREERWQTARDLMRELRWASKLAPAVAVRVAAMRPSVPGWLGWVAAGVFLAVAVVLAARGVLPNPALPIGRFEVPPPTGASFPGSGGVVRMAVSPNGSYLAFSVSFSDGKPDQLRVRRLDTIESKVLAGADGAQNPFWSADSRFIGFYADGKVKKVEVSGGPVQTLCDVGGSFYGGTWNRDGTVLFSTATSNGILRVSADGGAPVPVTKLNSLREETGHCWPRFLPDGRHFLYLALSTKPEGHASYVGSLDAGEPKRILAPGSMTDYAPPGYLLFVRDGALTAQKFDARSLQFSGEPFRVTDSIAVVAINGRAAFSVSDTGVLIFRTGEDQDRGEMQLEWVDRDGKTLAAVGSPLSYRGLDLSPDGKWVAFHRHDDRTGGRDIWTTDLERGTTSRFTFDASQDNSSPIWSPDGTRIAFSSLRGGSWGLYVKSANSVGSEELLFESRSIKAPTGWSPDGRSMVFSNLDTKTEWDVWTISLTGERKPEAFLQSPFRENHGQLSSDGRWVAYSATATGRNEIYVQSFPTARSKWLVSTRGGVFPRWRRDGKELFYANDGEDATLMAVSVEPSGAGLQFGVPKRLFDVRGNIAFPHAAFYHPYAVSADGRRFLIARPLSSTDVNTLGARPITVVLNWTSVFGKN